MGAAIEVENTDWLGRMDWLFDNRRRLFWLKIQHRTIDAIAQSGGGRAIFKHMTHMGAAFGTMDFIARHAQGIIYMLGQCMGGNDIKKGWPARAGIIFVGGIKQWGVTGYTGINTGAFFIQPWSRKRGFGGTGNGNTFLFGGEFAI